MESPAPALPIELAVKLLAFAPCCNEVPSVLLLYIQLARLTHTVPPLPPAGSPAKEPPPTLAARAELHRWVFERMDVVSAFDAVSLRRTYDAIAQLVDHVRTRHLPPPTGGS